MSKYVSRRNPVSVASLKRKPKGSIVVHHWNYGEVHFTRISGGWLAETETSVWVKPAQVVSSVDVANVCNRALGCKESWARIY